MKGLEKRWLFERKHEDNCKQRDPGFLATSVAFYKNRKSNIIKSGGPDNSLLAGFRRNLFSVKWLSVFIKPFCVHGCHH